MTPIRFLPRPTCWRPRLAARLSVFISLVLGLAAAEGNDSSHDGADAFEDRAVTRQPWARGPQFAQRQWLVLGPLTAAEAAAVDSAATAAAGPGVTVTLPGGRTASWQPHHAWTDVVEVSRHSDGSSHAPPERVHLLALAPVTMADQREVSLAFGGDVPARLWVNGHPLTAELPPTAAFAPDQHHLPATLVSGRNDVLVRLDLRDASSVRFALRIEPPGTLRPPSAEITPMIRPDASDLVVTTHVAGRHEGAPVQVSILAPGGKVVAAAEAARGQEVRFATAEWPGGPYEIRCSTQTAWGRPYVTHLPWYQGDLLAAARTVIEAASHESGTDAVSATRRAVARLIRHRWDEVTAPGVDPTTALARLHSPLLEWAELELERQGQPARIRPGGFYRLAYVDEVDGSDQFCRAYLPLDYSTDRRWPVIISLHGYNPANPPYSGWWSVDSRHDARAQQYGVIVLEPHGRGNAQYMGIGEQDVLRALDEAARRFSIDHDRVYLTGESMGGSGTWLIGSRHAGRFAAIAPVFGGWDMRVAPPSGGDPRPLVARNAREAFELERRSSFVSAEQLLNVPVLVHHGDADAAVSVENSRYIVRQLQRWGYDVRYHEMPGRGHEDLNVSSAIVEWLLQHRRNDAPRRVRVRSADLRGASAHWLKVETFIVPSTLMLVDAEMVDPGQLRLDAENVQEVTLTPPAALLGDGRQLTVTWNGARVWEGVLPEEGLTLSREPQSAGVMAKRPGVEGPISDLIRTPFLVVVGTISDDPLMRERCREKADAFGSLWQAWQHHPPRIVDDTRVTEAELKQYSLLLIGGANDNQVTRRLQEHVPLQVEPTSISLDGRRWDVVDAVAQVIYPHPLHAERYLMVVAATSADGLYFWNPALWHVPIGFPTVNVDWLIRDGRRLLPGNGDPTQLFVAAGVFDAYWRRNDTWSTEGASDLRARSPLRRAPASGFSLSHATLAANAGVYEIVPGITAVVTVKDGQLALSVMGSPPVALRAETEREFADPITSNPLVFETDESGRVVSLLLYDDAGVVRAARLD